MKTTIASTWRVTWPILGLVAMLACFLFAGYHDYIEAMHQAPVAIYEFPAMEAPCREPVANKELRIWVDKRLSETEGVRTCRLVPINGEASPRSLFKDAVREGVRG